MKTEAGTFEEIPSQDYLCILSGVICVIYCLYYCGQKTVIQVKYEYHLGHGYYLHSS